MDDLYEEAIYHLERSFPQDLGARDDIEQGFCDDESISFGNLSPGLVFSFANTMHRVDVPRHLLVAILYICAQYPDKTLIAGHTAEGAVEELLSPDLLAMCLRVQRFSAHVQFDMVRAVFATLSRYCDDCNCRNCRTELAEWMEDHIPDPHNDVLEKDCWLKAMPWCKSCAKEVKKVIQSKRVVALRELLLLE